jgi:hypothetical protein
MQQPMRRDDPIVTTPPIRSEWHDTTTWAVRMHWGSIFAGVVCSLAVMAVLSALGFAFGTRFFDTPGATTGDTASNAWFWPVLGAIIAFFAGGFVAGRSAWHANPGWGAWHGALVWAFTMTLGMFLFAFGASTLGFDGAWGFTAGADTDGRTGLFGDGDGTWWPFVTMLVGLVAAAFGGFVGAPKDHPVRWTNTTPTPMP